MDNLEIKSLQLMALLKAFTAISTDDKTVLEDLPIALQTAAQLAEDVYTDVVNSKRV